MKVRRRGNLLAELTLLGASLTSGIGALRLTTVPGTARVVLPVVTTVLAGQLTSYLTDRLTVDDRAASRVLSLVSSVVVVWFAAVWTTMWSATRYGLPTLTTLRVVEERFAQAGSVITSTPTPLPPTTGVVLCFAAGAGLTAVLGRALWRWKTSRSRRSTGSLYALAPSFGLFCYASLLSSQRYRLPAAVAYACAAIAFLAVADLPDIRPTIRDPDSGALLPADSDRARRPLGPFRLGVVSALVSVSTGIAALLLVGPGLSNMTLDALPFPGTALAGPGTGLGAGSSSGPFGPAQDIVSVDLIDDLSGFLTLRSQEVMFSAKSTVPTYWQVGTLTSFEGSGWVPDTSTEIAARQPYVADPSLEPEISPTLPALPVPQAQRTYSVTVSLAGLGGSLLPVPPSTLSVSGPATLVPGIGALYKGRAIRASSPSAAGSVTYSAVAEATATSNSSGAVPPTETQLAPYLALPKLPSNVVTLAHQIVVGSGPPAAQATALASWFDDSGRFRYTLNPPQVLGTDPLSTFLFVTRAGFCQQFAGAFAVLARLDGLPTRLAVGFTAGTPFAKSIKAGSKSAPITSYRITGADAHVWPEVYLGPSQGWVSFEPTPPANDEPSGIGVVSGNGTSSQSLVPSTTATPASVPNAANAAPGRHLANRSGGRGLRIWLSVVLVCLALAAAAAAVFAARRSSTAARIRRRLRSRSARTSGPTSMVLARFDTASWALSHAGLGRHPDETIEEHVARIRSSPERGLAETYDALARIAERACYSADPCTEQEASEAARLVVLLRRDVHATKERSPL